MASINCDFLSTEQELDRTRVTLQAVLDSTLSVVLITDSDLKIIACSRAALEVWEMPEDEVIGQPFEKMLSFLKFEGKESHLSNTSEILCFDKVNAGITTGSGKTRSLLLGCNPLRGSSGGVMGLIMVGTDITSLMEKHERIIENERLALIGQLTSGIAHEIKNPLTVISGFAEVTKGKAEKIEGNDRLKETICHYQQEIIDNCRSMNRLIIDLLQLASPKKTDKIRVNLAETLEKICNTVGPYALQNSVTLTKNLEAAGREVLIDPVQIGQVMLNFCNNAVQAMPYGGVLGIETRLDGDYLVIRVSDTGTGISPEGLTKLGTPFFTTKPEGIGLGLSVSYSIIRDHNGRIEVESEVGRGTTFNIFLPLNV
ncbi:MAG: two-component system sensor histidine kinase NtrB [Bacillota bacterium]